MATSKKALVRKPAPVKPRPDPNVVRNPAPRQPAGHVENQPSINYPNPLVQQNQPEAESLRRQAENPNPDAPRLKQQPLTPAQAEYKRVYPNTVYPPEFVPVEPQTALADAGQLDAIKAQVDQALASTKISSEARRQLDEVFKTAKGR